MSDKTEITRLVQALGSGDTTVRERLLPAVYTELRRLARRHMRAERSGHTLQATALVNEAYLRLCGESLQISDRVHFLALASNAMRRVLVDYARARARDKRGGGLLALTFDEAGFVSPETEAALVDLDESLERLCAFDPRCARVIELMFFGGLTYAEIADVLQISRSTVHEDLKIARAWLARDMSATGKAQDKG